LHGWVNKRIEPSALKGPALREVNFRARDSNWKAVEVDKQRTFVAQLAMDELLDGNLPDDLLPHYDIVLQFLGM
jgi:hypothetical protein